MKHFVFVFLVIFLLPITANAFPAPFIGTWKLVEFAGYQGTLPSRDMTLELKMDNNFSGSGPCNRFGGTYTIGDNLEFTMSQIENDYFAAFANVKFMSIGGGKLILLDESRNPVFVYHPHFGND